MALLGMGRGGLIGGKAPETPWWLAGGIAAADCVAAYGPKGAASAAASYVNLAHPGTHDAAAAGAAPDFDPGYGWICHGDYLTTDIVPGATWSMIARFRDAVSGIMAGSVKTWGDVWWLWPNSSGDRSFRNGGLLTVTGGAMAEGVLAVCAAKAYSNDGVLDGTIPGGTAPTTAVWLGALNSDGSPNMQAVVNIERLAFYNRELTAVEVSAWYAATVLNLDMVSFGDSISNGFNASDLAHSWDQIVATAKGYRLNRQGTAGTPLQNTIQNDRATVGGPVDNNGRDTYAARVTAQNPAYVYILYGVCDMIYGAPLTSALYGNDLGEVIDGIVAGGVPASNIVIGSPPYIGTVYASLETQAAYTAQAAAVAAAKGTLYADVNGYMQAHGADELIDTDHVHPIDAGHAAIATAMLGAA